MKYLIIANPAAGGNRGKKMIPELVRHLERGSIGCDLLQTTHHRHAEDLVRSVDVTAYQGIISAGGDGTNFHVLNGLLKHHDPGDLPCLGIIPVGSGNSFAMDLGIRSIRDGLDAILANTPCEVDVLSVFTEGDRHYFVNLAGAGFVADVARTAARFKVLGDFSYVLGVLYQTIKLEFHDMELELDGVSYSGKNCFVEFCNSRFTGGAMLMAPAAVIDDGYFDAVIVSPLSRMSLLAAFPKIFKGTHGLHPAVRIVRARHAVIRTAPSKDLLPDGELCGTTPATIDILPKAVRYFCLPR